MTPYTAQQLDALRELANIGSGTAGTALSGLIGRSIDVSVPSARALPVSAVVDAVGPAEALVTGVGLELLGEMEGLVLLLFEEADEQVFCSLLGVGPRTELGLSAMGEIGNILGASYVAAIGEVAGMALEPAPPVVVVDMLGAIVASAVAPTVGTADAALLLDSSLRVEGERCSFTFLLLPTADAVAELFSRLDMAG
jgi:chemotaxis protein CheC